MKGKFVIKKLQSIGLIGGLLFGIVAPLMSATPAYAFAAGSGTEISPYQIIDCSEFADIGASLASLDAYYVLNTDLDCSGLGVSVMVSTFNGPFTGTFNGNDKTVTINIDSNASMLGLFQQVNGATINNLTVAGTIDGVNGFQSGGEAGMVAGRAINLTATNIHSTGSMGATEPLGSNTGGLIGSASCANTLTDSDSSVSVYGAANVGGLVGSFENYDIPSPLCASQNTKSTISSSSASGNVSGTGFNVGGLVGYANNVESLDVYAIGDVSSNGENAGGLFGYANLSSNSMVFHSYATGDVTAAARSGGVAGSFSGTLSQSYATGDVTGGDDIGGLFGLTQGDTFIRDSYTRGNVFIPLGEGDASGLIGYQAGTARIYTSYSSGSIQSDSDYGGLIGNGSARFTHSFWDAENAGTYGICDNSSCAQAIGKTTAQMKTSSTYTDVDWNFDTIWARSNGVNDGYPTLLGGADVIPAPLVPTSPLETILDSNQFQANSGVAQGWKDDDNNYNYELPFSFNFYGQDYTSVDVSTNGLIEFGGNSDNYDFAPDDFNGYPAIIALSGDLDADCSGRTSDDIYVTDLGDGSVRFRWQVADHDSCEIPLNFEIVLHSDGQFQINYGDNGTTNWDTYVGVTDGESAYALSAYNGINDFNQLNTSAWNHSPQGDDTAEIVSAEDASAIRFQQSGCSVIGNIVGSKESTHQVQDPAFQYPVGFAGFTMTGCSTSSSVNLTFTGTYDPAKVTIRKYNSVSKTYTTLTSANSGLVLTTTTLNNQPALSVSYTITDNGPLDQDPTTGTITDPVGIGTNIVGVPNTGLGR